MTLADQIAAYLPSALRSPLKQLRDYVRFRSVGLQRSSYDGHLEFLGSSYGGYVLPKHEIERGAICYSFGAGEDISFESELVAALPVEVHIFDPTPRAIAYVNGAIDALFEQKCAYVNRLHMHPWGVWSDDQEMKFYAPKNPTHVSHSVVNLQHTEEYFLADCRRPSSIMAALGHANITLVKLNIEGAEYEVIRTMFGEGILPQVICINFDELHTSIDSGARQRLRGLVRQF